MTYSPSEPTDLPPPSIAVDQIRTNFSEFDAIFDNNHIALNASNQGKHSQVILQEQQIDPTISGNFADLFSKIISATSGFSQELHAMVPKFLPNRPNTPQQLTFNSVNTAGPVYQSFIAGGYIVYFGKVTQVGAAAALLVTLSPIPSEIVCVIANSTTVVSTSTFFYQPVAVNVINNFQFNVNPSGNAPGAQDFYWFAIARQ